MEKEQILQQLFSQTKEDKDILLEQLVFCKFANEYDFENYFRIGKLKESDLFCLISFLYHQDCFLMMLDIMNRYRDRFVSHDESLLKELDFSEQFMSRIEKEIYGGLHCGTAMEVLINDEWIPTRIEYGNDWYLVGVQKESLPGLQVRI